MWLQQQCDLFRQRYFHVSYRRRIPATAKGHLFLVYVNDMCSAVNCKLLLYADDSALIVPGKDVKEIELQLTKELKSISNWLTDNKLSLHLGKTGSILLAPRKNSSVGLRQPS